MNGRSGGERSEVRTCIVTGYGINADRELAEAFTRAGSLTDRVHIRDLMEEPDLLFRYGILGFPGGFSFGDHLGSGKVFAFMFRRALKERLERFVAEGNLIIGICNGFQVLVKMGVLPNMNGSWIPEVSLIHNASGVFMDRWVRVSFDRDCRCVWTRGLSSMDLPIRHGEGKFVTASPEVSAELVKRGLVALRYEGENPNGSELAVAGVTDPTGRILGLMPHPEAFLYPENHPLWKNRSVLEAEGLHIFRNGVEYRRTHAG